MSLYLLALQAAVTAQPVSPRDAGLRDFDLATVHGTVRCGDDSASDIVVCGHRKAMDVVIAHPVDYSEKPVRANVALPGGGTVSAEVVERELPGARSTAAMVHLKIPF